MSGRRRSTLCLAVYLVLAACVGCEPARAQVEDGERALRSGRYAEAIGVFGRHAASDSSLRAQKGLLLALREVGRYQEAEETGRRLVAGARGAELSNTLGEVLYLRGKISEADAAFRKAITARAADSLMAQVNLAVSHLARGDRATAMRSFDRVVDAYGAGARLSSRDLTAIGIACRHLGADNPQLFKDALKAFDESAAADPGDLEPLVMAGELFLDKYNSSDAGRAFDDVLRRNPSHPRALLGKARQLSFDNQPGAGEAARKSLKINPNFSDAHVFLAAERLGSEDYGGAASEAELALAVNPASLEALSVLAAARYLEGDRAAFEGARARVLARNPAHADLYATLAELSARNRLYREAADFARQAVQLDPRSWRGHGLLGMNELRLGRIQEGRQSLETSFAGDPYDVWTKNTLDLLDTFKDYAETSSGRFTFMIERGETDLLSLYVAELADEAYQRLAERYGYRPTPPVRLEMYRSHADFSVRTVGLAGLGALGVSFGTVLAMDSPSAREAGQFNWGSTLWHELAHTFTLGMTDHKVPRWLSEGISVLEERRARTGWGAHATPGFLLAYKRGLLLPVARLNDGFMRPSYPDQIIVSYYQASLLCELIEREWGPRALPAVLEGYRVGQGTEQIFRRVLSTDLEGLDRRFDAFMRERFAGPLDALHTDATDAPGAAPGARGTRAPSRPGGIKTFADRDDFATQLVRGRTLFAEGMHDEAVPYLERAKTLFPEYAEADSPYWLLGQIHAAKGRRREAADELTKLTAINESAYAANVRLAGLLDTLGDHAGAAAALDRAIYIYPYESSQHERLAQLYARLGDRRRTVRERRAVLALAPVDRAEALYQLAVAYREAGDASAARREVLRALEIAPNFQKAQDLLLELRQGTGEGGG